MTTRHMAVLRTSSIFSGFAPHELNAFWHMFTSDVGVRRLNFDRNLPHFVDWMATRQISMVELERWGIEL